MTNRRITKIPNFGSGFRSVITVQDMTKVPMTD